MNGTWNANGLDFANPRMPPPADDADADALSLAAWMTELPPICWKRAALWEAVTPMVTPVVPALAMSPKALAIDFRSIFNRCFKPMAFAQKGRSMDGDL